MRNVYLAQVNNSYGRNVFLPYSVGLLQAYAERDPRISASYHFADLFFERTPVERVIDGMRDVDVLGLSCYIWNWEYNIALARAVRAAFPQCLIVLGGPHVPNRSDGFFETYPFIDLLAHYEGEMAFADILLERLLPIQDYTKIHGLSVRDGTKTIKTAQRGRIEDPNVLPSPYLTGVFDRLMLRSNEYDFHASQETHRGCPYSCTFCDWGSNIMAKVKTFDTGRLVSEIEWFAIHKIDLLYNCDANYGLFKRDIDLTQKMADIKAKHGFPNRFRAAYAKNSNDTVYQIAKILHASDMNKGITLSFQSMNEHTLELIKRKNIQIENFRELMSRYHQDGITTYSEIIIGLPGETYQSFANGLNTLMECGQHDSIQVYNCEILPNSEMNDPAYKDKHGIVSVKTPVPFFHGTPSQDPHQEQYELIIGTNTLSKWDWVRCHRFAWIVQSLHCLSLTQSIAIYLRHKHAVPYQTFYETLLSMADGAPETVFGSIVGEVTKIFENLAKGQSWGMVDARFGSIVWPPEECGFLKAMVNRDDFYQTIKECVAQIIGPTAASAEDTWDVMRYQEQMVIGPYQPEMLNVRLSHNVHDYIKSIREGSPIALEQEPHYRLQIRNKKPYKGDLETYAKEVIWYGRKGGKFVHSDTVKQPDHTADVL